MGGGGDGKSSKKGGGSDEESDDRRPDVGLELSVDCGEAIRVSSGVGLRDCEMWASQPGAGAAAASRLRPLPPRGEIGDL